MKPNGSAMRVLTVAIALTLCASAAATPVAPAGSEDDPGGYAYIAEPVGRHITLLRQRESFHVQPRANVEIIEQARGVVLIDTGGSTPGAEAVIARVRALTRKPVTAIVITQWHGDHALGAARLLQEWPQARLISTAATRDHLANPEMDAFMPGDNAERNAALQGNIAGAVGLLRPRSPGRQPDGRRAHAFRDHRPRVCRLWARHGRYPRIGSLRPRSSPITSTCWNREAPVELHFLGRANTDGDAVVWLPRQRVLITSGVVVSPIPYGYGGYPHEWIGVLRRLETFPFTSLIPAHGAPMHDHAYLDRLIGLIQAVQAQVAPLAASNTDAVAAHVELSRERAQFVGADPWLIRWFDQYWTAPIVSSALHEARGQAIVQGQ